jgi:leader peptidase (prepilin peptidase)/N-methyltransferase
MDADELDRNREPHSGLRFGHDVGGDIAGEKEMRLGVPLIPDRAAVRSTTADRPTDALDTSSPLPRLLVGGATLSVVVLIVAVAAGTIPLAGALAVGMLVPAAVIDVRERRLPDAWVGAGFMAAIATLVVDAATGAPSGIDVLSVAVGAIVMALPVLALHLASPSAMGFGDVKAAVVLGAAVGTVDARLAPVALCLAAAGGAAVGLATHRRTIPFGPFLVGASLVVLLAHGPIIDAIFDAGGRP